MRADQVKRGQYIMWDMYVLVALSDDKPGKDRLFGKRGTVSLDGTVWAGGLHPHDAKLRPEVEVQPLIVKGMV